MTHHSDQLDLGYSWKWTYGHLLPGVPLLAGAAVVLALGWPWWAAALLAVLGLWMLAGFLVMRVGVRMNEIPRFRISEFAANGPVEVLDVGCGSGRLTITIARARPEARIVGLDNFSAEYIEGHGVANTERNYRAAGIADRASTRPGDMRDMPFADGAFAAAASSSAIDHQGPGDVRKTLGEVHRVLEPGGQFLLLVSVPNIWLTIAWGPLIAGKLEHRPFWRDALTEAGFTIEREGTVETRAMFLARRG